MDQLQLRKLIGGFLILATIASSGAFVLSNYLTSQADAVEEVAAIRKKNVFLAEKPEDLNMGPGGKSANLTTDLAETIAQQIISQNSQGPTEKNGKVGVDLPDNINKDIEAYISNIDTAQISFDIDENRINIKKNPSEADFLEYFNSMNAIVSRIKSAEYKALEERVQSKNKKEDIGALNLFYADVVSDLYKLKVPEQAVKLNEAIIRSFEIPRKVYGANIYADPLKSYATLEAAKVEIGKSKTEINQEIKNLKSELEKTSLSDNRNIAQKILGVQEAHAFFAVVIDIITEIETTIAEIIGWMDYALNASTWYGRLATEILKDRLLKLINDAILNWANGGGGGEPAYVSNWNSFLGDTFTASAASILKSRSGSFCSAYRDDMTETLSKMFSLEESSIADDGEGCDLDRLVDDVIDFGEGVSVLGIDNYLKLATPSNNYRMSIYFEYQRIMAEAEAKKKAAELAAVAGKGYPGTQRCENGQSPKDGVCADGSTPETTTPGSNISDTTSGALTSAIQRVVNAEDWTSLSTQLAKFAITKLVSSGNKGIRYGSVTGSKDADKNSVCSSFKQGTTDYINCMKDVSDTENPENSDKGGLKGMVLDEAERMLEFKQDTIESVMISIDTVSSSISILDEIIANESSCAPQAASAKTEKVTMEARLADLLAQADTLTSEIATLEPLIEEIKTHTPNSDNEFFMSKQAELKEMGGAAKAGRDKAAAAGEAATLSTRMQDIANLFKACVGE